jgi:hypothetical protein
VLVRLADGSISPALHATTTLPEVNYDSNCTNCIVSILARIALSVVLPFSLRSGHSSRSLFRLWLRCASRFEVFFSPSRLWLCALPSVRILGFSSPTSCSSSGVAP